MALRFWRGTTDANWSNTNNWASTSGGATPVAIPLATDDVTFDSGGNNPCTIDTSNRVAKTLTVTGGYTNAITFTFNLSVSGSITIANSAHTMPGAGLLRMIAAGTWTTNGKVLAGPIEIGGSTTFTCTLADSLTTSGALTLTNTTSTIFAGAFAITAASCTVSGTQTVTLVNNLYTTSGLFTLSDACVFNGGNIIALAGLTISAAMSGTTTLSIGGGTWQGSGSIANPIVVDGSGTITLSGTINLATGGGGGSLTFINSGSAITTTGSTLSIGGSYTIDVASSGVVFANITLTAALTLTLTSLLTASGTLTLPNAAVTFATSGFTVGTLTNTTITATRIYTFATLQTYTINTAFTTVHAAAQTVRFTFTSSSGSTRALFVLGASATQDVGFLDPTRIDASGGRIIFTYHGVLTDSPGWANAIADLGSVAYRSHPQIHLGIL